MATLDAGRVWFTIQELRLNMDSIERPNTEWVFLRFLTVEISVITNHTTPLMGNGQLPDWLQQKKGLVSLDTYNDNLCLWRCLALHQDSKHKVDRCTAKTCELAQNF